MKALKQVLAAACAVACLAGAAHAQLAGAAAEKLVITSQPGKAKLQVSSSSFAPGGPIPKTFTAYGDNRSPALSWSAGPAGTVSYLVILEDPDARSAPFLHWILGDLTAQTKSLPEGVKDAPPGAFQTGASVAEDKIRYFGPRPPSGVHNYTFEVFALDKRLSLYDGSSLADVKAAMTGHVLASGAVQGTYAAPSN